MLLTYLLFIRCLRRGDDELDVHANVILGGEPIVGRELIGGITRNGVEAGSIDSALTAEDRQAIRARHPHRPAVDPISVRNTLLRPNIIAIS